MLQRTGENTEVDAYDDDCIQCFDNSPAQFRASTGNAGAGFKAGFPNPAFELAANRK